MPDLAPECLADGDDIPDSVEEISQTDLPEGTVTAKDDA